MVNKFYVDAMVQLELEEADKEHPNFASYHEGYAVIKEEAEECADELNYVLSSLDNVWDCVRNDSDPKIYLHMMKKGIYRTIAEAVQVAAMIEKCERLQKVDKE